MLFFIRDAEKTDMPQILDHMEVFMGHTIYKDIPFDREHFQRYLNISLTSGLLVVAEHHKNVVGVLGALSSAMPFNPSIETIVELAMWVEPECRGQGISAELMSRLEKKIQRRNPGQIKYFSMVSMQASMPEEVNKIYMDRGFHLNEMVFSKRIE